MVIFPLECSQCQITSLWDPLGNKISHLLHTAFPFISSVSLDLSLPPKSLRGMTSTTASSKHSSSSRLSPQPATALPPLVAAFAPFLLRARPAALSRLHGKVAAPLCGCCTRRRRTLHQLCAMSIFAGGCLCERLGRRRSGLIDFLIFFSDLASEAPVPKYLALASVSPR